jgi:CrcB protein
MKQLTYVAAGGFVGTCLRFWLSHWFSSSHFPWGTLFVNWTGCFALAWLTARGRWSQETKLFLGTGLIGSYTTFSAFSAESLALPSLSTRFAYILFTLAGGMVLAWLGQVLGRRKPA